MSKKRWEQRGPNAHLKNADFGTPVIQVLFSQDTFDHNKGQKSAISVRHLRLFFLYFLQRIFSPFPPGLLCNLVKNGPKRWRKLPDFWAEKEA